MAWKCWVHPGSTHGQLDCPDQEAKPRRILVRCRRVSLEELRDNHDSELVNYKSANERRESVDGRVWQGGAGRMTV